MPGTNSIESPARSRTDSSTSAVRTSGPGRSWTGEIAVRGPTVFEGYYRRPEKTDAVFDDDGWFYTEDIARVDEDGYFWMVDRADDMIIAGGENIYPAEVEDALYEHPDVAEAAVVAAPHEVKARRPSPSSSSRRAPT